MIQGARTFFLIGAVFTASVSFLVTWRIKASNGMNGFRHHQHRVVLVNSESERETPDQITSLPGLDFSPGFRQYSGYLDVSHTRHIFYWFVESQSNPSTDPLVFWTNGGPGCSGMIGLGGEHGPFYISRNGKLSSNPFSWNKVANMLYVEQPAGVGFSYGDTEDDLVTGDQQSAEDNVALILNFLERFPNFRSNPLYVASESYGGHYVPQLTLELLKQNGEEEEKLNLKGFLVGNPYVDPFSNMVASVKTAYYHGLVPKPLFDRWLKVCADPKSSESKQCGQVMRQFYVNSRGQADPYALDFPLCLEDQTTPEISLTTDRRKHQTMRALEYSLQGHVLLNQTTNHGPPFLPTQDVYRPCSYKHLEQYLRRADVRQSLHVKTKSRQAWSSCSDNVKYSEKDVATPTIPLYQELVDLGKRGEHDLDMLIFSGDDDSVCATSGTQEWVWSLGVEPLNRTTHWDAWKVQGQTAGFVTQFDMGTVDASLTFATVHGAGHEVPACRPMEALELFRMFLKRKWQ